MIHKILEFLDENEIDYRLVSNFCCGYVFYFLDGSIYPRRYYDYALERLEYEIIEESVDHVIEKAINNELQKDWKYRIESESIESTFKEVEEYLIKNYRYNK